VRARWRDRFLDVSTAASALLRAAAADGVRTSLVRAHEDAG